jgi:hypothetical protein
VENYGRSSVGDSLETQDDYWRLKLSRNDLHGPSCNHNGLVTSRLKFSARLRLDEKVRGHEQMQAPDSRFPDSRFSAQSLVERILIAEA